MGRLVHTGLGSSSLVAHVLHFPLPPREELDDDVFYLFFQKQKRGAELHIYLEEGTYHKRLFRGPNMPARSCLFASFRCQEDLTYVPLPRVVLMGKLVVLMETLWAARCHPLFLVPECSHEKMLRCQVKTVVWTMTVLVYAGHDPWLRVPHHPAYCLPCTFSAARIRAHFATSHTPSAVASL